jgi:shikimate dehydrogenase
MINGKTVVYGIIGNPVAHSFSPAMHNAAMRELGINCVYVPFCPPPEKLGEAVAGIRALGIAGVNVTVPYKEVVIPHLDELTGEAKLYGAVNTIINRRGVLTGHNTDGPGLIKALREDYQFDPGKGPAVIFGAGGAARAVAVALARSGCPELAVVNRRFEKALKLAEMVAAATGTQARAFHWDAGDRQLEEFTRRSALLVNCTPVGMAGGAVEEFPLPGDLPGKGQLAYDTVYNPPRTPFLVRGARNGAVVANGLSMLLYQGVLALEEWTGLAAPVEVMRRELYKQAGISE